MNIINSNLLKLEWKLVKIQDKIMGTVDFHPHQKKIQLLFSSTPMAVQNLIGFRYSRKYSENEANKIHLGAFAAEIEGLSRVIADSVSLMWKGQ